MAVRIDTARTRASCAVCGKAIASEPHVFDDGDDRADYGGRHRKSRCHVACALASRTELARAALLARASDAEIVRGLVPVVEAADRALAAEVRARLAHEDGLAELHGPVATRPLDADPQTRELVAQLAASPGDRATLAVLADVLQQRGDARGELIALQLGGGGGAAVAARRKELFAALAPWTPWSPADSPVLTAHWGIGFVEGVRAFVGAGTTAHLRELFEHDSLRLLSELELTVEHDGDLAGVAVPAAVRHLSIAGQASQDAPLWRALPHLERLELGQTYGELEHPGLTALRLVAFAVDALETLTAPRLPRLVELAVDAISVHVANVPVWEDLARSGLLAQLARLEVRAAMRDADLELLARGLGGRRLARLAVHAERLPLRARPRLEALAEELVLDGSEAPPAAGFVEHANKPEWGRGRILRAFDGKLEIEFASGVRVIKADAPFLRVVG